MNIVKFVKSFNKKSARQARERLQIVISHQRATDNSPEFISKLRQEMVEVISKYIEIDIDNINVQLQQEGNNSVLELNVTIPDEKKSPKFPWDKSKESSTTDVTSTV